MDFGLLWYDNDAQRALEDKIGQAARRYLQKYGRLPNVCYVHPQALAARPVQEPGLDCRLDNPRATIRVLSASNILIHHFWLGENSSPSGASKTKQRN